MQATTIAASRGATRRRGVMVRQALLYLLLAPSAVVFLAPLVWMLSTSLKTNEQFGTWPPVWIPSPPVWENYPKAWSAAPFALYLRNTLIITVGALVGQLLSASAVAYGFARLRFPGRDVLFVVVLATMMLPGVVTLIPTYILFNQLGWLDTFAPLIVPAYFGAGGGAFYIFLLRQFFRAIPLELSEAAKIDGASNRRILLQLILPLSRPALATVTIFGFMAHWNDFMGPLIYLTSRENATLTLGLRYFISANSTQFQYLMAISFLMSLPIILVFFFAQQYFVRGVVMSGLKG
ncbi:MAG TPA: carbohydrate ABC transporter permease [Chloroflexota bacterium]|jgi:ABC-type glycerol-3-phosphate transport system permease component|nr:carbohydrate ABC transporter permease [Chloroflexota bacterium]